MFIIMEVYSWVVVDAFLLVVPSLGEEAIEAQASIVEEVAASSYLEEVWPWEALSEALVP